MLLNYKEVAHELGIAEYTARRWMWEGRIPSVKLGKKLLRARSEDIEALIHANTRKAKPEVAV